jgi:hypothetical protein
LQGWYIVTYALAIYHLNLFLAFLTPKIDPAMSELDGDEGMSDSLYIYGHKGVAVLQLSSFFSNEF